MSYQVVITPMTTEEARVVVDEIKSHIQQARALLLDLHEREGWKALGYSSWEKCVTEEFGKSRSYVYRQLAAAKLELKVGSGIGEHPESHMRAISETLDDEEDMQEAYSLAASSGAESASQYRRAAMEVWLNKNLGDTRLLRDMKDGLVSIADAYIIGQYVVDESLPEMVRKASSHCRDPELVEMLVQIEVAYPDIWDDIVATGCIPGIEEMVPLTSATASHLKSYLTLDSAERRAQYVEQNREYYDNRQEVVDEIISEVRALLKAVEEQRMDRVRGCVSNLSNLVNRYDEL